MELEEYDGMPLAIDAGHVLREAVIALLEEVPPMASLKGYSVSRELGNARLQQAVGEHFGLMMGKPSRPTEWALLVLK